jgi:hypothetical protein
MVVVRLYKTLSRAGRPPVHAMPRRVRSDQVPPANSDERKEIALSRRQQGFESPWGRQRIQQDKKLYAHASSSGAGPGQAPPETERGYACASVLPSPTTGPRARRGAPRLRSDFGPARGDDLPPILVKVRGDHNPKVGGSNPSPATNLINNLEEVTRHQLNHNPPVGQRLGQRSSRP